MPAAVDRPSPPVRPDPRRPPPVSRAPFPLAVLLAGCSVLAHSPAPSSDAASLAAAESAFAAQSVREGMRAAFLAWLSPDATLYRNGPVNGPAHMAASPDPPIVLDWRPVFVEVAASGELGLSTGPWTAKSRRDPAAPVRHGQFVSLWKRAADGAWRVRVDLGISHPEAALASAALHASVTPGPGPGSRGTLAQAEERFARTAAGDGEAAAYAQSVSSSVRLYRDGHPPFLGRQAAATFLAARGSPAAWTLESHEVSASGDFGYATGSYGPRDGAAAQGHFVRAWRLEPDGWRIALDIVNDLPPRPP